MDKKVRKTKHVKTLTQKPNHSFLTLHCPQGHLMRICINDSSEYIAVCDGCAKPFMQVITLHQRILN